MFEKNFNIRRVEKFESWSKGAGTLIDLAEQSKLLAVNAAIEAAKAGEQGSKAVASGMESSAQADEAIRILMHSIEGAAQAATQIAVSAQQQWAGMDQVALAMHNIGQASAENVICTQQAEETARKLHELGLKLKQLAAAYRPEMAEPQGLESIC